MIDIDYLPSEVLNFILKSLGWEPGVNDERLEALNSEVAEMGVQEAFRRYCTWHGLLGNWDVSLSKALDSIRNCATESVSVTKVTPSMIKAGLRAELELKNAKFRASSGGLGGGPELNWDDFPFNQDLIKDYVEKKLDSVTVIYMVMERTRIEEAKEKQE